MQLGTQAAGEHIPPTRRQQLENKKFQLERELDVVKAAIAALDAHPDLEEFSLLAICHSCKKGGGI